MATGASGTAGGVGGAAAAGNGAGSVATGGGSGAAARAGAPPSSASMRRSAPSSVRSPAGRAALISRISSASRASAPLRSEPSAASSPSIRVIAAASVICSAARRTASSTVAPSIALRGGAPSSSVKRTERSRSIRSRIRRLRSWPPSTSSSSRTSAVRASPPLTASTSRVSTSSSTTPRMACAETVSIAPPLAEDSWSSDEMASRNDPPAWRAIRRSTSSSAPIDSASAIRRSASSSSSGVGRRNENDWQRPRTVSGRRCGSVVQRMKMTCGGGSSSVFRSALAASVVREWASSRM